MLKIFGQKNKIREYQNVKGGFFYNLIIEKTKKADNAQGIILILHSVLFLLHSKIKHFFDLYKNKNEKIILDSEVDLFGLAFEKGGDSGEFSNLIKIKANNFFIGNNLNKIITIIDFIEDKFTELESDFDIDTEKDWKWKNTTLQEIEEYLLFLEEKLEVKNG